MFETEGIICARTRAGERLGWLRNGWAAPLFLFLAKRVILGFSEALRMQPSTSRLPYALRRA